MQSPDDQTAAPEGSWEVADLHDLLTGVAGVESLEIDLREDGSPRVRVHLDGSISGSDVGDEIRQLLTDGRPEGTAGITRDRRAGLGRDLADILATDATASPPAHLQTPTEPQPVLALVAVEETAGGISVRAGDSLGGVAFSPVEDPRSLNQAVVSAVARLRQEKPLPRLAGVEIRDVDDAPVLTAVLALADGHRVVGSALVAGGMPFTLGRAVWEALASRR